MKTPLSPSDIEVLIWCHCRPEPHERMDAPAVAECVIMWQNAGMVEPDPDSRGVFRTTDKGRAMIEALCNTPEPRCAWIDAHGRTLLIANARPVRTDGPPRDSGTHEAVVGRSEDA